ncbi:hypothetical protein [Streptomyces triticisoli]|uniref:hypothetical protein n=1 Tax=Streptomyces triticisoli TaxID=2182797 RepID=UPI001300B708|nr:hypothetical protein [Streptomyces triticisoli]
MGWPETGGRTAAWPDARPGEEQGHRPGVGAGAAPDPAPGSWFDKGRPAGPVAEAETQVLPEQALGPVDSVGPVDPLGSLGPLGSAPESSTRADTEPFGLAGTGPLRVQVDDPWQTDGTRGTHDPHEVTIQLDAIELGGPSVGPAGTVGGKEADRPVFVDESGRRSRRFRRLGMAVGLACAVYAVVIVVTLLSGNAAAPWVPLPGADDTPASKVKESPLPSESADPSADTGGLPEVNADPSAPSTGATPSPGATVVPGTSAQPGTTPGASTPPTPSVSSTKKGTTDRPAPPAGPGGNSSPSATNPAPPDPPATDPGPGPDPDPDPTGGAGGGDSGGNGTNTNAGPAAPQTPFASGEPAMAQPGAAPAQSPENVL